MQPKTSFLFFLIFFLNFYKIKSFRIQRKLSFISLNSSSTSSASQIVCETTSDCPAHSVCYQNACICDFGYTFVRKVECVRIVCYNDTDCQNIFLHSKCLNDKEYCACAEDAYLNSFNQECYQKMNRVVLWFGFLSVLGIIILLPVGKLIAKQREINRLNKLLEEQQMVAEGPLGTLSFGNVGAYDDAYLYYFHTVNNGGVVSSNAKPINVSSPSHAGHGQQVAQIQEQPRGRIPSTGLGAGAGGGGLGGGGGSRILINELEVKNEQYEKVEYEIKKKSKKRVYFRSMSEQ